MTYNSPEFLFLFMPIAFIICALIKKAAVRDIVIIALGVVFISYGQVMFAGCMILTALANFILAEKHKKALSAIAIALDIGLIAVFKYAPSVMPMNAVPEWMLPIGVSVFSLQMIGYVIDMWRSPQLAKKSSFRQFMKYSLFFPQLIAGPVLKYKDFVQNDGRLATTKEMAVGINRFVLGLAKFVLLAGILSQMMAALPRNELTLLSGWVLAIAMCLSMYFSLSGYADMAIGLGHMLGYSYKENFNYPFAATSVRDFIKRWYVTITAWFIDYLYKPLGKKTYALILCAVLIAIWLGDGVECAIVGLVFGVFILLEKRKAPPKIIGRIIALVLACFGIVVFSANGLPEAMLIFKSMVAGGTGVPSQIIDVLNPLYILVFAWALFFCVPHPKIKGFINNHFIVSCVVTIVLFALCSLGIAAV